MSSTPSASANSPAVEEHTARFQIHDCILRYARGIDRRDYATFRLAFWPEASLDSGPFKGSVPDYFEAAQQALAAVETAHQMFNSLIEFRGQGAIAETYFSAIHLFCKSAEPAHVLDIRGRYVDRCERRDGEWRIISRVIVFDYFGKLPDYRLSGGFGGANAENSHFGKPGMEDYSWVVFREAARAVK